MSWLMPCHSFMFDSKIGGTYLKLAILQLIVFRLILLMVQKSGIYQLRLVVHHSFSQYLRVFCTSQVMQDFFHQQYTSSINSLYYQLARNQSVHLQANPELNGKQSFKCIYIYIYMYTCMYVYYISITLFFPVVSCLGTFNKNCHNFSADFSSHRCQPILRSCRLSR